MRKNSFPVMLFAAGFGTRMGALTADRPKPLIPVAGRTLMDHALAQIDAVEVGPVVVNLHYRGEQIVQHLNGRNIQFSWENDQILETGGGMRAALPMLGSGPVIALNTDAVWTGENPLLQLMAAWDESRMDALLLLLPVHRATGHKGRGDFLLSETGHIRRANGADGAVYLGAQIIKTAGLYAIAETVFSLNKLWDRMIAEGRAYGLVHHGGWCDVGSPEGIVLAETMLAELPDVS
jgi:MurNAc alpha-1-phosphate uridylyltransferase